MRSRRRSPRPLLFLLLAIIASPPAAAAGDSFDGDAVIEETGAMAESASATWWLNSGGRFHSSAGIGATLQGFLPVTDRWRLAYAASSAVDTDDGYRPQNLFRFVSRSLWSDFQQQVHFRIAATNLTDSPNRAAHNGILFFIRYLGGNDLYYAGLRVDGAAVIKKKIGGVYTTLGYSRIYPGTYDRVARPTLLPEGRWIGLRAVTKTNVDGSVSIRVEVEDATLGSGWLPVLDVVDSAGPISGAGFAGIRTDFMDVEFEDYENTALIDAATPTATATPTMTKTPTPTPTRTATPAPTSTPTAPVSCSVVPSPVEATPSSAKQNASFAVLAPAGCGWSAKSSASWLTIRSGASGKGTGTVAYAVARNVGPARQGTITVQGAVFAVRQGGK